MVLIEAPLWYLAGLAAVAIVVAAWRPLFHVQGMTVQVARGPIVIAGVIMVAGAAFGAWSMTSGGWDYFWGSQGNYWFMGLMLGLGYVTVLLLFWRVWLHASRSASITWAPVVVLAFLWVPALVLGLGVLAGRDLGEQIVIFFAYGIYPGLYGIPTFIVLLALVAEAKIRLRRVQQQASEAPPGRTVAS